MSKIIIYIFNIDYQGVLRKELLAVAEMLIELDRLVLFSCRGWRLDKYAIRNSFLQPLCDDIIFQKPGMNSHPSIQTYGKVFLVRKIGGKDHGTIYAMKVLRKTRVLSKQKTLEHTLAERQVLERLRGVPFLVNLYYAFQTETKLHIVMGIYLLCFFLKIRMKVIYRDLKLENILLDEEGHVKLTDFGLSKLLVPEELDRANSYCGTIEYMLVVEELFTKIIIILFLDSFYCNRNITFVCILYIQVIIRSDTEDGSFAIFKDFSLIIPVNFIIVTHCLKNKFFERIFSIYFRRIITKKVPFPKAMDSDAKDFIASLLEKKLEKRLGYNGIEEIKKHRFLCDVDWEKAVKRQLQPFIIPNLAHDLDVQNFATEFTNQQPLYSPAESPINANTLFRGYSYISPSVIFANNNVIGEELMQEDIQALLANSSFFGKYKLDTTEKGFLGRGSFSVCRRCERIEDGAAFAVKIISQRFATQAQREARILDIVKGHVNTVRLIDVHSDPLHFYIVMELLTGQELLVRLRKLEKFTEAEAADIMRQLVSAVGYLHAKRIVHRDLKPESHFRGTAS
uniref:Non-specific serine/threonine protein kinase n=1 Tax=Heterorhabditis bacteriophora TaxID=37862 RepID=A0A1I7WFY9_HETBA